MTGITHGVHTAHTAASGAARGRRGAVAVCLLVALATACGWGPGHHSPDEQATWFYERGEEWVVEALEDVDASDSQIEGARAVFDARRVEATAALERFFGEHRSLLRTLAGGAATPELLEGHAGFEAQHERALREIGALHAALEEAVGASTWADARERMRERAREHMEE